MLFKHVLETVRKRNISRLSCTAGMCRVQAREDLIARIRLGGKLNKERREETPAVLLVGIPEIEVVIEHGS